MMSSTAFPEQSNLKRLPKTGLRLQLNLPAVPVLNLLIDTHSTVNEHLNPIREQSQNHVLKYQYVVRSNVHFESALGHKSIDPNQAFARPNVAHGYVLHLARIVVIDLIGQAVQVWYSVEQLYLNITAFSPPSFSYFVKVSKILHHLN